MPLNNENFLRVGTENFFGFNSYKGKDKQYLNEKDITVSLSSSTKNCG